MSVSDLLIPRVVADKSNNVWLDVDRRVLLADDSTHKQPLRHQRHVINNNVPVHDSVCIYEW